MNLFCIAVRRYHKLHLHLGTREADALRRDEVVARQNFRWRHRRRQILRRQGNRLRKARSTHRNPHTQKSQSAGTKAHAPESTVVVPLRVTAVHSEPRIFSEVARLICIGLYFCPAMLAIRKGLLCDSSVFSGSHSALVLSDRPFPPLLLRFPRHKHRNPLRTRPNRCTSAVRLNRRVYSVRLLP